MLEKSVVEKCCKEVLEKSVGEKCCREVFFFSRPFFQSERSAQATSLICRAVSSRRSGIPSITTVVEIR